MTLEQLYIAETKLQLRLDKFNLIDEMFNDVWRELIYIKHKIKTIKK